MKVLCPTCKKEILWSAENLYRPFCCARCRLIDLGAWADGSYSIADKPSDPNNEDETN